MSFEQVAGGSQAGAPSIEALCANTVRGLAMDAIQKANSGHPGMPMGTADVATVLWGEVLEYDPSCPDWANRDRVVLSAGHGSMLLYSMLYLTGTALSLDDLKRFRQWGSPTAGHPEHGEAPGIETTTGPLGQGISNGVGMALAEKWLRARFGADLVDHWTYVIAGDGCIMEGISSEAASLAAHLGLGRLVVLYDDNQITIDGSTSIAFSEDVARRFEAQGWHAQRVDGHDNAAILDAIRQARAEADRPSIICCRTRIAKGSPKLEGSNKSHGAPLGAEEVAATKRALGLDPDAFFAVPEAVTSWLRRSDAGRKARREAWEARLAAHPERERWARFHAAPDVEGVNWPTFEVGTSMATRKAGSAVLQAVTAHIEQVLGGSADLAESNATHINGSGAVTAADASGRNLNFGIREHAMAGACNGLALHGGVQPFCATFLVFHDYMRPAVRLASLMRLPVIYVYTHDSVHVGEDGPTHQPIEHLQSMRLLPGFWVFRPADASETVAGWKVALRRRNGPTALCLSRQNLPVLDAPTHQAERGGYVVAEASGGPARVVLVGTGSEVSLALEARVVLQAEGLPARVVSLPCWELFFEQDAAWRDLVLPPGVPRVSVEAGVTFGWERIVGSSGASVGIDRFGASAPGPVVADKLGMNVNNVVDTVRRLIG